MHKFSSSSLLSASNSLDMLSDSQSGPNSLTGIGSSSLSVGSSNGLNSSQAVNNHTDCSLTTDDEDSDHKSNLNYKERRREAHTQAEQKRRDAIKKGYEDLQYLVPTCQQQDAVSSYKLSKATILQRSIDYIQFLQMQKKKHDEDLQVRSSLDECTFTLWTCSNPLFPWFNVQSLRKEVIALQIMKSNYEQIVKLHQRNQPGTLQTSSVSDEVKFHVFQSVCDELFQSFDACVKVRDFNEISACIFSWIEENCKPSTLRTVTNGILSQLKQDGQRNPLKQETIVAGQSSSKASDLSSRHSNHSI
jgi:MAX-like protein X